MIAPDLTPLEAQLVKDEGAVHHLYLLNGIPHCGVGHNLQGGPDLSDAAVVQILRDDIAWFQGQCATLPQWAGLNDARQGVLVNLCFNVGVAGLKKFVHLFSALDAQDYDLAGEEIVRSHIDPQRAKRLARQMKSGTWI